MFERFTDNARSVVVGAQAEARALHHNYIGTEHILLGLTTGPGLAARILSSLGVDREHVLERAVEIVGTGPFGEPDAEALRAIGIDLDEVRRHVEDSFGPGALDHARRSLDARKRRWWWRSNRCGPLPGSPGHIPFTPRAKKVLELSLREAIRMKDNFIGTEHILLGLVRENGGVAAMILADRGVDHAAVLHRLRGLRGRTAS
jgi:ATP-dependent Clp protease ATP-binding subunit ClpA